MSHDTPLTVLGDEAVEARIVARVLGEASAFEAAELDRLCRERPEYGLFERRMRVLHALLGEAPAHDCGEPWRLPADQRERILASLGGVATADAGPSIPPPSRRRAGGLLLAAAACLVLTTIGVLVPRALPGKRSAVSVPLAALEDSLTSGGSDHGWFGRHAAAEAAAGDGRSGASRFGGSRSAVPSKGQASGSMAEASAQRRAAAPPPLPAATSKEESIERSRLTGTLRVATGAAKPKPVDGSRALNELTPGEPAVAKDAGCVVGVDDGFQRRAERAKEITDVDGNSSATFRGQPVDSLLRRDDSGRFVTRDRLRPDVDRFWDTAVAEVPARDADERQEPVLAGRLLDSSDPLGHSYYDSSGSAAIGGFTGQPPVAAKPMPVEDETSAASDPVSTFSLNIGDASFRIAQAAVAAGGRPDPAVVRVEQFYNAPDYQDPAPAAGEPVAVTIEQGAHPLVPGRNLVRIALKTAASGRAAKQPLRLTLLADQSGSMAREDRREAMEKALAGLVGLLTKDDQVSVIGFSRRPRLLADGLAGDQAAQLAGLVNQSASEGGTNLEEAVTAAAEVARRRQFAGARNRLVLFTDGAANLGNADPVRLAGMVKDLRQQGIAFDIAGIVADGLNDGLLGELARHGNGRYHVVGREGGGEFAAQLAGAFRPAAENVKVQVHFNPARVARYRLIGFEQDRLRGEDFRNDAVDAAELAAEETGVAVYQIEPVPDGSGELGEVAVRFRDTASGEMVERTWVISDAVAAPPFDRASPSMQLAALAMLAGEKLRGGPQAATIDFKQFEGPLANVRRHFGGSGKAAEVIDLIDRLATP